MPKSPIHPGAVDWTGENPGIYLKEQEDGPWTGLMCFFRIVYSPHGMGHGIVVFDDPNIERGLPAARTSVSATTSPLARYLVAEFFSSFASFRVSPGIKALTYLPLTEVRRRGDTRSSYSEVVRSRDYEVVATWEELGQPYAVDMPPEKGPTKRHEMYSLFIDAQKASVTINGQPLRGKVVTRDFADTKKSTAFLGVFGIVDEDGQVAPRGEDHMVEALQFLLSGLVVGSIYGLVGVGFTGIYNVTGIVNFAQGDFAVVGALTAITLNLAGMPLLLAALLAIVITCALAALVERTAIRPVRQDVIRGIIITIGIGVVIQGAAVIAWGTDAQPMPAFSSERPIDLFGATLLPQSLWVIGTATALVGGLYVFFQHTYLGKMFRACAMNPFAARLVGVRVATMSAISFMLSGILGAVAGIIIAPIALTQYDSGLQLGIKGFVACIIGGFGNPIGAALGGLLLGILEAFAAGYVSSGYKNAIAFVLLLLFLFFRPGGLLGDMERASS